MARALFMVIEHFKNGDAVPIYRRFRDKGRMMPVGVEYVASWVNQELTRCYQLMEAEDRAALDAWAKNWTDLADFEVHPVITSKEAVERIGPRL
jgi:hypothetical protein